MRRNAGVFVATLYTMVPSSLVSVGTTAGNSGFRSAHADQAVVHTQRPLGRLAQPIPSPTIKCKFGRVRDLSGRYQPTIPQR
jgi:hypothetical protein